MSEENNIQDQMGDIKKGDQKNSKLFWVVLVVVGILVSYVALSFISIKGDKSVYSPFSELEISTMFPVDFLFYSAKGTVIVSSYLMTKESASNIVSSIDVAQMKSHYFYYVLNSKLKGVNPYKYDKWFSAASRSVSKIKIYPKATIVRIIDG